MVASIKVIEPRYYRWDPLYHNQPYSLAVEKNGFLFISGLTAEIYDPHRKSYIINNLSLVDQTRVIFEKMGSILDAAGYTFQDVVYTVDYALEPCMPEYRQSGEIRRESFSTSMPASTGVLVEGLPNSVALMKVNAVAMRQGREKKAIFPEGTPTWERFRGTTFWPGFFVGDDWFWLSGSTGRVYDTVSGREMYPNGIENQRNAIWENNLGQVMLDAGVNPSTLVRTSDYVHPAGVAERNETGYRTSCERAESSIVVRRLLHRKALLEIDATCYLGRDREVFKTQTDQPGKEITSAVRCGKVVFCSIIGSHDTVTGQVSNKINLEWQLNKAYENMSSVLETAGLKWSDVVRSVEMVSPRFSFDHAALDRVRKSVYGDIIPSVTTVTANQILTPDSDFTMELWAVLD